MSQQLMSKTLQFNKQTLQYGNEEISYQVFFLPNQRAKVVIDVLPNGLKAYYRSTLNWLKPRENA
jgi:hypothetical protein